MSVILMQDSKKNTLRDVFTIGECDNQMNESKCEGYRALACTIEVSARLDPDPLVGRLYPKSHHYLMKMEKVWKKS